MKSKLLPHPIIMLILLIGVSNQLFAQVNTNFNNKTQISARGKFNQNFAQSRTFTIPARDIKALNDKDATENQSLEARPFKIAEPINVVVAGKKNYYATSKLSAEARLK